MATIKQLKIGNTNYDIKALNATNNDQANAVVRDIQYGTAAPSGGSAGQVYLQYNSSTTDNPYVYAEDTVGSQNVVDNYYSKSEIQSIISNIFTNQSEIIQYKFVSPYNRFKIGDTLFLYGNTAGGNDLSYGITFDSTPIIIAGPPIVNGPSSAANIQVYNIYTNKYSLDTNYGSTTKRNVGVLIIGRYSGDI